MDSNKMCCNELKVLAKKAKIKGYYKMKKEELSLALGLGPIIERQEGGGKRCEHGKVKRFCVPCGGSAMFANPAEDHNFANTLNKNINVENVIGKRNPRRVSIVS